MSDPRRPLARSEEPNEEIALAPRDVSHPRGLRPGCSVPEWRATRSSLHAPYISVAVTVRTHADYDPRQACEQTGLSPAWTAGV